MNRAESLLVVDDEPDFAAGLARLLECELPEARIAYCCSGEEALQILRREPPAVLLTDLRMPGISGLELLEKSLSLAPETSVLILTAYGDISSAVEAIKAGAYDFLTKPVERETLIRVVSKALERARLLGENKRLRLLLTRPECSGGIIGESPAVLKLREKIFSVASTNYTVLITGESGTGKELVARTVHRLSQRAGRPFCSVNCPAIPAQLQESELFGHLKGAFTGADRTHKGLFLAADNGTLLLDEIGDMDLSVQTKLLRVIQESEVRPVGSSRTVRVDVRLLATTNQNLEAMIQSGQFREDLYHRINVLCLQVPPLRERGGDVALLARYYLAKTCSDLGLSEKEFSSEALARLSLMPWPGNVRELINFVRRLVVHTRGDFVGLESIEAQEAKPQEPANSESELKPYIEAKKRLVNEFSKTYFSDLLRRTGGGISEAARLSGLQRWSLQKILKRCGVSPGEFRGN